MIIFWLVLAVQVLLVIGVFRFIALYREHGMFSDWDLGAIILIIVGLLWLFPSGYVIVARIDALNNYPMYKAEYDSVKRTLEVGNRNQFIEGTYAQAITINRRIAEAKIWRDSAWIGGFYPYEYGDLPPIEIPEAK